MQHLIKKLADIRLIVVVAFLIRLTYASVLYAKNGTTEFCDDYDYIFFARDVISQGIMVPDLHEDAQICGPSWPLIITPFIAVFGENYWPIIILNVLLSTAQVYLIYLLGFRVFRNKYIGLFAAAWACFYVPFFNYAPFVLKENFNQFFFALSLLYFLKLADERKIWSSNLVLFVISYSIFIHGDERYFFYLPLLLLGLFLIGPDKKQNFLKTAAFGLLLLLSMLPWLYRNYQFFGRPVILTIRTAGFTDKLLGYPKPPPFEGLTPYEYKNVPLFTALADSLKQGYSIKGAGVKPAYRNTLKTAIENGVDVKPYSKVRHYWEEFAELWRPVRFKQGMVAFGFRYEKEWFWYSNLIYGLSYGLLLPFMFIGLILLAMKKDRHFWIFFLIMLFHTLLHVFIAHVRTRYRYPIDSIVILMGVYGIFAVWNRFYGKNQELENS